LDVSADAKLNELTIKPPRMPPPIVVGGNVAHVKQASVKKL